MLLHDLWKTWFKQKGSGRMDSVRFEDEGLPERISNIIPILLVNVIYLAIAFGYIASIHETISFFSGTHLQER